jgi:hypothetical protein
MANYYHCTESRVVPGQKMVLVPGCKNLHGLGVLYMSKKYPVTDYGYNVIVLHMPDDMELQENNPDWNYSTQGVGLVIEVLNKVNRIKKGCYRREFTYFDTRLVEVLTTQETLRARHSLIYNSTPPTMKTLKGIRDSISRGDNKEQDRYDD